MRGHEKEIRKAYRDLKVVLTSLNSQRFSSYQYESPSQKLRGRAVLATYDELLRMRENA